jgi:hypothetical protein
MPAAAGDREPVPITRIAIGRDIRAQNSSMIEI